MIANYDNNIQLGYSYRYELDSCLYYKYFIYQALPRRVRLVLFGKHQNEQKQDQ